MINIIEASQTDGMFVEDLLGKQIHIKGKCVHFWCQSVNDKLGNMYLLQVDDGGYNCITVPMIYNSDGKIDWNKYYQYVKSYEGKTIEAIGIVVGITTGGFLRSPIIHTESIMIV